MFGHFSILWNKRLKGYLFVVERDFFALGDPENIQRIMDSQAVPLLCKGNKVLENYLLMISYNYVNYYTILLIKYEEADTACSFCCYTLIHALSFVVETIF